jgi:hypothetical protein
MGEPTVTHPAAGNGITSRRSRHCRMRLVRLQEVNCGHVRQDSRGSSKESAHPGRAEVPFRCSFCEGVAYAKFHKLQRHQLLHHPVWQLPGGSFAEWTVEDINTKISAVRRIQHATRIRRRAAKRAKQAAGSPPS